MNFYIDTNLLRNYTKFKFMGCCGGYFCTYFKELFGIGNSAGSLIVEACNLMRTFQRLSATHTFSAHFSTQCLNMFNWATVAIQGLQMIFFESDPFTEFELFYLLACVFPILILVFLTSITVGYRMYFAFLLYGVSLMLGSGLGYFKYNLKKALGITIPCVIIIIIFSLLHNSMINFYDFLEKRNKYQFTFAVLSTCIIMTGIMSPVLIFRVGFTLVFIGIVSGFCFLSMVIEFLVHICHKYKSSQILNIKRRLYSFCINCFSLLLVPATDVFMKIMKNDGKLWNVITIYIGNIILLPIVLTFFLIILGSSGIKSKYKESKISELVSSIELIDIIKQILYSIVAALDLPWACIVIEFGWCILIVCTWPYSDKSEYSLSFGNSLIMFISNGIALYGNYKDNLYFSFKFSIILVCIACLPAIISIYIYFIFDFKPLDSDSDSSIIEGSDMDSCSGPFMDYNSLEYLIFFITPFIWIFYGLSISLLTENIVNKNE